MRAGAIALLSIVRPGQSATWKEESPQTVHRVYRLTHAFVAVL